MDFMNYFEENQLITEGMIVEAFDSPAYDFVLEQPRTDNIFAVFTEEETGSEFRIQFYSSVGLGKGVRRVRIGRKQGGASSFTDASVKFKNPQRVIATLIAASEEFFKTPVGMKADGYAFELTRKAAPRGVKLIRQVMKRKFRTRYVTLDSTFSPEEGKSFIWVLRKGKNAEDVFNGPKNKGMIGDIEPVIEVDIQKEIAEMVLSKPFKEITGEYSGSYNDAYRLVVEVDGTLVASKGGTEFGRIVRKDEESPRKFVSRASSQLSEWQARMENGEWDEGTNRWKTTVKPVKPVNPVVNTAEENSKKLIKLLKTLGFTNIEDVGGGGWPDFTIKAISAGRSYTFMPGRGIEENTWALYPGGALYNEGKKTNFNIVEIETIIKKFQVDDVVNTKMNLVKNIGKRLDKADIGNVNVKPNDNQIFVKYSDKLEWTIDLKFDVTALTVAIAVNNLNVAFGELDDISILVAPILRVINDDIDKHNGYSGLNQEYDGTLISVIKTVSRISITNEKVTATSQRVDFTLASKIKCVAKFSTKSGKVEIVRTDSDGSELPKLQYTKLDDMPRGDRLRVILSSNGSQRPKTIIQLIYNTIVDNPIFKNVVLRGNDKESVIIFEENMYGIKHVIAIDDKIVVSPLNFRKAMGKGYNIYMDVSKWQKIPYEIEKATSIKMINSFEYAIKHASNHKSVNEVYETKPLKLKHIVANIPLANLNVEIKEISFGRAWEFSYGDITKFVITGKQFDDAINDIESVVANIVNEKHRMSDIPEWQLELMNKLDAEQGIVFRVAQSMHDGKNTIAFTSSVGTTVYDFAITYNESTNSYAIIAKHGHIVYGEFENIDDMIKSIQTTIISGNSFYDLIKAVDISGNGEYVFEQPEFLANMDREAIPYFEAIIATDEDGEDDDIYLESMLPSELSSMLRSSDMPKVRNTIKQVIEILNNGGDIEELRGEIEKTYDESTSIIMMETFSHMIHKEIDTHTTNFINSVINNSKLSQEESENIAIEIMSKSESGAITKINNNIPVVESLSQLYRLCNNNTAFKRFIVNDSNRAYYKDKTGEIAVTDRFDLIALWHEFGHSIEFSDKRILNGSIKLLEKEANAGIVRDGKAFIRLRDEVHHGFDADEIAVNGNFINLYTGRAYTHFAADRVMVFQEPSMVNEAYATEVISMGFQYLSNQDGVSVGQWAKSNPQHYRFVMSVINQLHKGF